MSTNRLAICLLASATLLLAACAGSSKPAAKSFAPVTPPTMTDTKPRDYAGLHNVVAYHDNYYSGSVPEGDAGFDALAGMGIKTIISVDGAVPEVEAAKARGIRYIHLPIGYNGFSEERKLELIRATRDSLAQGPVYIHCHHGKHRSAGAAATVAAAMGWSTNEQAVARMKVSGTAPGYKGLYKCASEAKVLPGSTIDAVAADFPEITKPGTFVASMVEMDEVMEHLKAMEKAGWKSTADRTDLEPAAEAGRLADLLRVAAQGGRAAREGDEFRSGLEHNADAVQPLEDLLAAGETDVAKLSAQFSIVQKSCKSCHEKFRD